MDVVIAGASGLLGTALRDRLREAGHRPVRLVRPSSDASTRRSSEGLVDTVSWDPSQGRIEASALEGVGAVVNFAGEPLFGRWTARRKQRIRDSRLRTTTLLATALAGLQRPPSVLLSASAIGWYGDRGDEVLTETSPPGQGFLPRVCREWEASTAPASEAGIRVVNLRTGLVLSTRGGLLATQLPVFRLGLGARLGSGQQWMPWISIEDHAGATLHLLERGDSAGPVNLTAPSPVRNFEFAQALGRVLNRPVVLRVPKAAVRAVFGSEFVEEFAFSSARVLPARLRDLGYTFRHLEVESALADQLQRR